ncbi:signal peptidase I [Streptomyces sp. NP160]|uniref:signal peptidase I n=1 Tax=Streptomyces sp. NP160 TaxID=2586637 RepID=UPI00111A4481|nr:signal peptidase I [Streptomyces sp. NP160]TNM64348.1 signal peptidase I [Streptomyces sp. NP160]
MPASSSARTGRHTAVVVRPARGGAVRGAARRTLRAAVTAAAVVALAAVLAALAAAVLVPRAAGATPLVVLTGSMAPGMPAGSVAVVRPVDPASLRAGDVVTYEVAGGGALITHRVVATDHDASGALQLTTRGDANDDDDQPVPASAVRGQLWYSVPWVGYASDLLRGSVGGVSERVVAVLLAGTGLLVYAGSQLVAAARDRRRPEPPSPWAGRTASRELAVVTLEVGDRLDLAAFERAVEACAGTVLATTDTTVSVALTAAPALVDEAVDRFRALARADVQRSGALSAPLGPGSPQLRA